MLKCQSPGPRAASDGLPQGSLESIWERDAGFPAICSGVESAFLHFSFLVYTLVIKFCFPLLPKPMVLMSKHPNI